MSDTPQSSTLAPDDLERYAAGADVAAGIRDRIEASPMHMAEVERLRANNALLAELAGAVAQREPPVSPAGPHPAIDGYRLISEIHRGGQGIVYRALQLDTGRTVAIKVLLSGTLATSRQRRRFEREIELIAGLHHPNIVTVHHSGRTPDGRHFFVMEHIEGLPLTDYFAADSGESPGARMGGILRVFRKVCAAVGYAHQHAVIHRDLKPGNILVDPAGEPHVLDFGLAKTVALSDAPPGARAAPVTITGEFMGTLTYASPEQLAGLGDRVDVRSDVYALGVMLYELVTGHLPFDTTGAMQDLIREITRTPPIAPSAWYRRGSHAGAAPTAAQQDPSRRGPLRVGEELETIILKALEKEPARRYQSAVELERDIGRYLAGEPIEAKRDSAWYLLRTTVRRHRVGVSVASCFVMLVLAFAGAMTVQATRLAHQRNQARLARDAASLSATKALAEARKARSVADFFVGLLRSAAPVHARGKDITVRQMVADLPLELNSSWKEMPELEGAVRSALGTIERSLGDLAGAEVQLRGAVALLERAAPEGRDLGLAVLNLGIVLRERERWDEAEATLRRALAMTDAPAPGVLPDEELRFSAMHELGTLLRDRVGAHSAEARTLIEGAVAGRMRLFGEGDIRVQESRVALAAQLRIAGDSKGAEALLVPVLEDWRVRRGEDHPDTLMVKVNLANCLLGRSEYSRAVGLYRDAIDRGLPVLGERHPALLQALSNYGAAVYAQGDPAAAEVILRDTLTRVRAAVGDDHRFTISCISNLGYALQDQGKLREAREQYEHGLAIVERVFGPEHQARIILLQQLGSVLVREGEAQRAESLLSESLDLQHRLIGSERVDTLDPLSEALMLLGRYDEAEPLLLRYYNAIKDSPKIPDSRKRAALERLVALFDAMGRPEAAAEWRARLE